MRPIILINCLRENSRIPIDKYPSLNDYLLLGHGVKNDENILISIVLRECNIFPVPSGYHD
jgi:hypothetical protein